MSNKGWRLSPAFDMNPTTDKAGLALNIDLEFNELDFELARSVGTYFQLSSKQMDQIIEEVQSSVASWEELARKIGIPSAQRRIMENAFHLS